MIDKAEIKCRFKRSVESYDENAHVQKIIVEKLYDLLTAHLPEISCKVLEIGCGTGLMTRKLRQRFGAENLFINDLVKEMCHKTAEVCGIEQECCIIGDIEQVHLKEQFNLIVSASTFQWLGNPATTFKKLSSCLGTGDLLVFSTFGCRNLWELCTVTGSGLHYLDMEENCSLLSPYFDIIIREEELHTLCFDEPLEILRHLKKTGANAGNASQIWTKGSVRQFSDKYNHLFLSGDKCPLTYHPLYFVCRRK